MKGNGSRDYLNKKRMQDLDLDLIANDIRNNFDMKKAEIFLK